MRPSALWGEAKAAGGAWLKQTLPSPWCRGEREALVDNSYRNRGEGACGEGQGGQLLPWSCLSRSTLSTVTGCQCLPQRRGLGQELAPTTPPRSQL